jgi:hypothetical protein
MKFLNIGILLIVVALLIFFREPAFFFNPQIWAEEGALYFQYAYTHTWFESLFAAHLGYYSLFGSLSSTIAAKLIPLEGVAMFFLLSSLFVQLIAFAIILFSKSQLWDALWKKAIGFAIVLFTLLSAEIWLNTINSQFYFSLITFLILLEEVDFLSTSKKWCYRILLCVSGLSGVISLFLAPIFFISLLWDKSKERMIQCGILLVTGVIQGFVFLSTFSQEALYYSRFQGFDLYNIPPVILLRSLILPLLGPESGTWFLQEFITPYISTGILFFCSSLIIFVILFLFSSLMKYKERIIYLGSYLCLLVFSIIASLGETSAFLEDIAMAQRYFYVANVVLLLMVFRNLQLSFLQKRKGISFFCGFFITLALINGMMYFRYSIHYEESYPDWSNEVKDLQENADTKLQISPPGWEIRL